MRQTASKLLREHYVSVANELLTPLQVVMATARAEFDGDLDKFIVLMEVVLRTASDKRLSAITSQELMSGDSASYPTLGTNIRSIAQSSGIPRETVRRKVLDLLAEGWIERNDHTLGMAPKASKKLTPVRDVILDLAARNYQTVMTLAERNGGPDETG